MYPKNMHDYLNKFINKYLNTINHNFLIKGLLYFNLSYQSGNLDSTTFEAFNEFLSSKEVNALGFADDCNVDIKVLKDLYSDLSGMSEFIKDNNILSLVHELSFNRSNRKNSGIYYTPEEVVKPILDKLFNDIDIVNNPYIKILDPACGCGNFLCCAYEKLYELYRNNSGRLTAMHGYNWDEKFIKKHIVQNNLFGADIDNSAIAIARERLSLVSGTMVSYTNNIVLCNSLLKWEDDRYHDKENPIGAFWNRKFDFIIGNPPYQNMQKSSTEFKEYVKVNYSEIYNGQNDLYYYFIYRAIDRLKEGGKLCFIVPPYFIKSTHGGKLRNFIVNYLDIHYLEDITYLKPFYKTQIHSCIFTGVKKNCKLHNSSDKKVYINNKHNILLTNSNKWIIVDNNIISIIERLDSLKKLGSHASICKGMDTGLNECFLVNQDIISQYNLEPDLLKPVIRSGDIEKYFINRSLNNTVLYITNQIDISRFPNTYKYLTNFYERLKLRWAYKRKLCNWHSISTPRNNKLFESKSLRLFVPYRSRINRFALDNKASIGLTDTTVLFSNDDQVIYYLTGILNSKLISFYNSYCGKRKGDMFEFFSVPISNFPFIASRDRLFYEVVDNVKKILDISNTKNTGIEKEILYFQENIDNAVFEIYCMDDKYTETILSYIENKRHINFLG